MAVAAPAAQAGAAMLGASSGISVCVMSMALTA